MENIQENAPNAEVHHHVNEEGGYVDEWEGSDSDDYDEALQCRLFRAEERERAFDAVCERVKANHPDVTSVDCDSSDDDNHAAQLGRALVRNTHVTHLSIFLLPAVTEAACNELVHGICCSQVQSLQLRGRWEWSLPLDLARLLVKIKSLFLDFVVDDPYSDRLATAMMLTSSTTSTLENLQMPFSNISIDGFRALAMAFSRSRLLSLTATDVDGLVDIQEFCDNIQRSRTIKELTISGNMRGMGGLAAVVPQLSKLFISSYIESPSIADMEGLANGIQQSALNQFKLTGGKLGDDHMRPLFRILASHPSLQYAEVRNNLFGDDGLSSFVENWNKNSAIQELHFTYNKIGVKGLRFLLNAVVDQPQLRKLNLWANTAIGYEGLALVGHAIPGLQVKELNVRSISKYTEFADVTCEAAVLQEEKLTKARKALLEGVRNNVCLRVLNLTCNKLGPSVQAEVDLYMEANGKGRRHFLVEQHNVPTPLWGNFLARMSPSLGFLFLRELPTVVTMGHGTMPF